MLSAQGTIEPISVNNAITIVQDEYTDDEILEMSLDTEDGCWYFELESDTVLCVFLSDGTIVLEEDLVFDNVSGTSSDDDYDDEEDDDEFDEDDLVIVFTAEEAIAEALRIYPNETVVNVELEVGYDDLGLWDVELDSGREVDISITTGNILGFGFSSDDVEPVEGDTYNDDDDHDDDDYDDDDHDDDDHDDDDHDDDDYDDDDYDDDDYDDDDYDDDDYDDDDYDDDDYDDDDYDDDDYDDYDDDDYDDDDYDDDDYDEDDYDEDDDDEDDDE
jgi:hypothetical protein